jgi:hypothetical protein
MSVTGQLVMIKARTYFPVTTNAVIALRRKVYYFVLQYRERAPLEKLQYDFSAQRRKGKTKKSGPAEDWPAILQTFPDSAQELTGSATPDTAAAARIAADYLQQRHRKVIARTTDGDIAMVMEHAMKLNKQLYFKFGFRNKSSIPVEAERLLLLKRSAASGELQRIRAVFVTGNTMIGPRSTNAYVMVTSIPRMAPEDVVVGILVLRNIPRPLVVKVKAKELPGFILSPD